MSLLRAGVDISGGAADKQAVVKVVLNKSCVDLIYPPAIHTLRWRQQYSTGLGTVCRHYYAKSP